jgi:hypothetical protein
MESVAETASESPTFWPDLLGDKRTAGLSPPRKRSPVDTSPSKELIPQFPYLVKQKDLEKRDKKKPVEKKAADVDKLVTTHEDRGVPFPDLSIPALVPTGERFDKKQWSDAINKINKVIE